MVRLDGTRYEPFPTGYGIQQIALDATVRLRDGNFVKDETVRALISLNTPPGQCDLELFADGAKVASGTSLLSTQDITANMKCTGVIYRADINVDGVATGEGPLTRADRYDSEVPSLFPTPVPVKGLGVLTITGSYYLLDGTRRDLDPQTLNVAEPPKPPVIAQCLNKCQYCQYGDPTTPPFPGCSTDASVAPLSHAL